MLRQSWIMEIRAKEHRVGREKSLGNPQEKIAKTKVCKFQEPFGKNEASGEVGVVGF